MRTVFQRGHGIEVQCELLCRLDVVDELAVSRPKVENRVGWSHPTLEIISREDLPNFVALRLGPCEPPGINRLRAMAHGWSTEWFKSYRLQSVLQSREGPRRGSRSTWWLRGSLVRSPPFPISVSVP